jgi:hypothetical protein
MPPNCVKDVFDLVHGKTSYPGLAKITRIVNESFFIWNLTRYLEDWTKYCPECQVIQTKRYTLYGSIQPILELPGPFHTITIDFILALLESYKGFDYLISIIEKVNKRYVVIPGIITWNI